MATSAASFPTYETFPALGFFPGYTRTIVPVPGGGETVVTVYLFVLISVGISGCNWCSGIVPDIKDGIPLSYLVHFVLCHYTTTKTSKFSVVPMLVDASYYFDLLAIVFYGSEWGPDVRYFEWGILSAHASAYTGTKEHSLLCFRWSWCTFPYTSRTSAGSSLTSSWKICKTPPVRLAFVPGLR